MIAAHCPAIEQSLHHGFVAFPLSQLLRYERYRGFASKFGQQCRRASSAFRSASSRDLQLSLPPCNLHWRSQSPRQNVNALGSRHAESPRALHRSTPLESWWEDLGARARQTLGSAVDQLKQDYDDALAEAKSAKVQQFLDNIKPEEWEVLVQRAFWLCHKVSGRTQLKETDVCRWMVGGNFDRFPWMEDKTLSWHTTVRRILQDTSKFQKQSVTTLGGSQEIRYISLEMMRAHQPKPTARPPRPLTNSTKQSSASAQGLAPPGLPKAPRPAAVPPVRPNRPSLRPTVKARREMEQSLSDEDGEPPLENEDPADDAPQELPDSELLTEVKRLERDTSFLALRISELKLEATSPTNQAIIRARATKEFNERLGQLEDQKYSIAVVFPLEKHTQRMNDLDLRNLDLPENLFELGRKDMRAEFRAFFRLEAFRDLQRTEENLADLLHELLDRAHPALEQLEHNIWQRRRTLRTAAESHLQELHYFKQMDTLEQKKKRQKSQRVHEEMKSLLLILEEPQGVYSLYDAELGHKMRMKTWLLWDLLAADIEVTSKLLHGLRSNVFTRLRHTFSSSLHGHQHRALRIQSCLSDMSDVCKEMDREIFNLFRAHKRDNTHLSRYMTNAVLRANRPATMVAQSTGEMYQTFLDLHLDGLRWPQTAAQHHIASTLGPVWLYLRQQRILQDAVEELVSFTTKAASRLQPRTDDPNDCSEPEHLHLNLDGFLEAYSNWLADRRDLLYCHNECSTWFGIFKLLQPNLVRDTSYGQKVGPLVRRQVEVLEYKPIVEAVNGLYREKLSWPIDDYLYPQQQAIPVYYICSPKYLHSALKTLKGAKVLGLDTVIRQQTVYSTYKTSQATALMLASEDCILIISSTILRENGYSLYEHGLLDLRDLLSDPQILKVGPNMTWTREALYHSFAIDMQGCVELGAHSASGALSMLDEDRNWPYLETLARQHDSIRLYGRPGVGAGFFCVVRHLATRAYAALKIYRDRYGFESPPKSTLATDARSAPAFGPLHLDDASVITGPDYFQLEVRGALQRLSSSGGSGKKIAGAKFRTDVLLAETYRMARHALARIKSRNDNGPGTQIALEHLQAYHLATTFTENDPRVVGELLGLRSPARTILQVAEVARLPLNDYHRAMFVAVKESEPPLAQEGRPTVTLRRRPWSTRSKTAPAGSLPAVSDDPNEHDALTDTATESPMDHAPPHDVQGPPQGRVRKYVFSERVIRRLKASRPSERRCERQWRIK